MYKIKMSNLKKSKESFYQTDSTEVENRWKEMDTNKDGEVSRLEFRGYLYRNEQKFSSEGQAINDEVSKETDLFIESIDTDNDGIMELDEMKPLLSAQIQAEELPKQYSNGQLKSYFRYVIRILTSE